MNCSLLNYHLFQKLKLIGKCKFYHLIITLTLPLTYRLKLHIKLRFNSRTFGSDTILNQHLSQKCKVIGKCKLNHLIITLTSSHLWFCPLYLLNLIVLESHIRKQQLDAVMKFIHWQRSVNLVMCITFFLFSQ
jgi:hypothetical protein